MELLPPSFDRAPLAGQSALEPADQAPARSHQRRKTRKQTTKRPTQRHHENGTPHHRASILRPALRKLGLGGKGSEKQPNPPNLGHARQPADNSSGNGGVAVKPVFVEAVLRPWYSPRPADERQPEKRAITTTNTNGDKYLRLSARDALWVNALKGSRKPGNHLKASPVGNAPKNNPHGWPNQHERLNTPMMSNNLTFAPTHQHARSQQQQRGHARLPPPTPAPPPARARAAKPSTTKKTKTKATALFKSITDLKSIISTHLKHHPPSSSSESTTSESNSSTSSDSTIPINPSAARLTSHHLQSMTGTAEFLPHGGAVRRVGDTRRGELFGPQVALVAPPPGLGFERLARGYGFVGVGGQGLGQGQGRRVHFSPQYDTRV